MFSWPGKVECFGRGNLRGKLENLGELGRGKLKDLMEIHGESVRGARTGLEGSVGEFLTRYFNLLQQHLSFGLMLEQVNQKTT